MQGLLVIPSFRGGAGFSGPAHSVEQEIGCTADSCRAQHVGYVPKLPPWEMANLVWEMASVYLETRCGSQLVLSWFSRLRGNKKRF